MEGCRVVALSKTQENLDTLKESFPAVKTITNDITRWETTRRKVTEAGPYNCLVNNAGIAILEPFLEAKSESFDSVFNVNVKAMFNISQAVAQQMIEHNIKGTIVNVSSQASQAAFKDHAIYCASKGAVDMLSKTMALELGQYGIRVNCVNPTVVMTQMGRIGWADPVKSEPLLEQIPLGRFAEVDEVVDAILYLLSDKSSMVTGVTLPIDGGYLAR
ncbi:hypothetical protein AAG570_004583 [Ranatra chinensis]|uniref:L-xylulose reductase n=1 Tax=Ranatra chinensis TaxID=642074 RepID=A0ABD0Y1A9_9HEMI